jgi:DNA-binding NarL/FixJ family response regulator
VLETDAAVIRVLIADDHPLMRKGLADILNGIADIQVVGAAEDGAAALALAHAVRPDIVLMDISMPGMDGIEATEKLMEMNTGARVVMLTSYSEREKITQALAAGAVSYLTKDSPPDAVIRAIRSAAASRPAADWPPTDARLKGRVAAAPRWALPLPCASSGGRPLPLDRVAAPAGLGGWADKGRGGAKPDPCQ